MSSTEVIDEQGDAATPEETQPTKATAFDNEQNFFAEDDMNLLDLISSFGQENAPQKEQAPAKKGGKK